MKSFALSSEAREISKIANRALRNQGKVPCVLYGGEKQVTFYAHENDFRKLVYTSDVFLVELDIDGTKFSAIMQDIQFHPVTDKILHIDFYQLHDDQEVTLEIPVRLIGTAPGVVASRYKKSPPVNPLVSMPPTVPRIVTYPG